MKMYFDATEKDCQHLQCKPCRNIGTKLMVPTRFYHNCICGIAVTSFNKLATQTDYQVGARVSHVQRTPAIFTKFGSSPQSIQQRPPK